MPMFKLKTVQKLITWCMTALAMSSLGGQALFAQGQGAVQLPPVEPKVDQLGQMEGVGDPDRTGLVVMLFLQVIALIVVAIALAGHLSMPAKKKTPKV
jgi:hypothetical protein